MRCAGKAGVVTGASRGLGREVLLDDPTDFDGTDDPVAARAAMEAAYPGKRIVHPLEVAASVVFLVSDESSFVNGTPILVDDGLTAKTY
jgi:NAD(P)-dependent dehydrogenase (short-subunit alcohol dehydrogenase family)